MLRLEQTLVLMLGKGTLDSYASMHSLFTVSIEGHILDITIRVRLQFRINLKFQDVGV